VRNDVVVSSVLLSTDGEVNIKNSEELYTRGGEEQETERVGLRWLRMDYN
jgi:hypothetical protein